MNLDFEASVIEIVVKSLVSANFKHLEVSELLQLLEISDYLQMEDMINEIEILLSAKLNLFNIYDIVEITELMHVPNLKSNYYQYIKENILHLNLNNVPKSILKSLSLTPSIHIKDTDGRFFDPNESELKIFEKLYEFDPEENWIFSDLSKKKLWFAINDQDLNGKKYYNITESLSNLVRNKVTITTQSLLYDNKNFEKQRSNFLNSKNKIFTTLPFGKGTSEGSWGYPDWSVEGMIRKISVKSRFLANQYSTFGERQQVCNDI